MVLYGSNVLDFFHSKLSRFLDSMVPEWLFSFLGVGEGSYLCKLICKFTVNLT
jgi:hypothetical protein